MGFIKSLAGMVLALASVCASAQSDLSVSILIDGANVRALSTGGVSVRVTNHGPGSTPSATLFWAVDAGGSALPFVYCVSANCTQLPPLGLLATTGFALPTLAPGEIYEFGVDVRFAAAGNFVTTARVTSSLPDPLAGNDSVTQVTSIRLNNADVAVSLADSRNELISGGTTQYLLRVVNRGPEPASSTQLRFTPGTGLAITAVACSQVANNACFAAPTAGQLRNGLMLPWVGGNGAVYEALVTARVTAAAGTVNPTATVTAEGVGDPDLANNSAFDPASVVWLNPLASGARGIPVATPFSLAILGFLAALIAWRALK